MPMDAATAPYQVVLHDPAAGQWIGFRNAHEIIVCRRLDEIASALSRIEKLVLDKGWHAAGFISYEAAPAFDSALRTHAAPDNIPLLWFGLYSAPGALELPPPDFGAYSLGEIISSVSRPDYERAIRRIREYILFGETYQVNYTLRLRSRLSGDPWHLFLAMARAQSPGYAAWIETGRHWICCASPELFFRLEGRRLTGKPMKGTVKRGRTLGEDETLAEWLRGSEKNRAENLMIVDMIRNDLGRVAETGTVKVARLFEVERHPTLWQMTSTVEADCTKSVGEILVALFPCASITGAPKVRTTHIISELEPDARGIYTGSIGYIAPGRSAQFNVAIRTAVVNRLSGQLEYGAGGGIVWDSEPGDEYAEALLKARVLTERYPEFSLLETLLWTPEQGYFLLEYHLRRLADSARYFAYRADTGLIRSRLDALASGFGRHPQRVRLLVGTDGIPVLQAAELASRGADDPVIVGIASSAVNSSDIFLYHKTTRREVYEAAQQACPDCDDVLLWNERGELTESCIANLVLEMDGILYTPPVSSGLLAGTFRALLLEQGKIRERVIRLEDLQRCRKIYLINSVRKWQECQLLNIKTFQR